MPNRSNSSEIINRLINDKEAELMPLELNRMLEEELAKPEAEIDVQLVDELLKLLEEAEPSEVEKRRMWQGISDRLGREAPDRRTRFAWRRVAVVAGAAVLLFSLTLGTAHALRWTFLLKLLEPLAQTFGIVTTDQLTESDSIEGVVSVEDDDTEQIVYDSLETMPRAFNGHVIVPGWVPEKYTFEQGTAFDNGYFEKYTIAYRHNDEWLSIDVILNHDQNAAVDYQYERAIDKPETIDVDGIEVLFYENSDEGNIYAAWVSDNANFNLFGMVTKEESVQIIESMNVTEGK
ncbi:MAG: DUF4367 domain-containing protein [Clostridiales bacterium]|nr:DUF4367 domain-containing protein [Clostridiales bacterium]